ncbi:OsmC family protein [Leucobacter allii]|uniref:OsmC family protein n=1 Tax=Leucobacter allii TaxID=2932247 RepID=A0ABY4FP15_9MICO|nr:OsmC family protein [Leucobacter allii]UOQ58022.1 OsmC family protein [Leucobacter allii]
MHADHPEAEAALFTAVATNTTGIAGESAVAGGLRVAVAPPTATDRGGATNPEELLALAWATCLNASARVVAGPGIEVEARAEISLHRRTDGEGFEFAARAELHFPGQNPASAAALAAAAHERCPVSRMLAGRSSVSVSAVA